VTAFDHAVEALLWSEVSDDGDPLDSLGLDLSPEAERDLSSQWETFREQAEALGFDPEQHITRVLHPDYDGDHWGAVAHDWIFTRNGHGVGFWEAGRWVDSWGLKLTQLCRQQGEILCWVDGDSVSLDC
jgi:hypothetical protein